MEEVEEDVKETLKSVENLQQLLVLEHKATLARQEANARERKRSVVFYISAILAGIFAIYWSFSGWMNG